VDGVPINELRYGRVRRQIGFVAQDSQLISGTIRENLQLVKPEATDEELLDVLRRASASPLLERPGQGLDTRLGESGLRVSGGERQRLSIARALLREPRLFIFDEATSALDSLTEREITTAVREVSHRRQHMVILIAHRLSTIAHADNIHPVAHLRPGLPPARHARTSRDGSGPVVDSGPGTGSFHPWCGVPAGRRCGLAGGRHE
jgi:ATP-binding cassette subfamily B protein